jgi:hypothetical protein
MFTDKELKYLKNIVTIVNEAKFEVTGNEILQIASSLTVLQSSIIPKVEQLVKNAQEKAALANPSSPIKEEPKKVKKTKAGA